MLGLQSKFFLNMKDISQWYGVLGVSHTASPKTIKATYRELVQPINNKSRVMSLAFSPDGKLLATGGFNRTIKLWEITTGREIATIQAHAAQINTMAIAYNSQTFVSSSSDRSIKLWQCNL